MKIDGQLVDKNFIPFHAILNEIIEREKEKHLIFEHVYISEIFEKLNTYITNGLIYDKKPYMKLTYQQIVELLPKDWKLLKYLNKNKQLCVLSTLNFNNQCSLNLTNDEINNINEHLQNNKGVFSCNFDHEKNIGLIIINDKIYTGEFKSTLTHELIHFFQWNTGKSIKEFFNNKQFNILNEKDIILEINKELNLSYEKVKNIIKTITSPNELESYINTIYYDLKEIFNKTNRPFVRLHVSAICEIFDNNNDKLFKNYYEYVKEQLKLYNLEQYLQYDSITILLILGYLKIGFNSFKNHIYSYFDKEQQKGKRK